MNPKKKKNEKRARRSESREKEGKNVQEEVNPEKKKGKNMQEK